jgi:hypothetical protein
MQLVSLDDAIRMAESHLNEKTREPHVFGDCRFVVERELIRDCGDHWIMFYQSDRYLQSQDIRDALVGNMPLKIRKADAKILGFADKGEL